MSTSHNELSLNNRIREKLIAYLIPDLSEPKNKARYDYLNKGWCSGFTTLWLYAKDLSIRNQKKHAQDPSFIISDHKDDLSWFYTTIDTIAQCNNINDLNADSKKDIDRLISLLLFFQNQGDTRFGKQTELTTIMERSSYPIELITQDTESTTTDDHKTAVKTASKILIIKRDNAFYLGMRKVADDSIGTNGTDGTDGTDGTNSKKIIEYYEIKLDQTFDAQNKPIVTPEALLLTQLKLMPNTNLISIKNIYDLISNVVNKYGGHDLAKPIEEFKITGHFTQAKLAEILPEIVKEGCMVYIGAIDHATAIIRTGDQYFYFDSNHPNAKADNLDTATRLSDKLITADEAASLIFMSNGYMDHGTISIIAVNWSDGSGKYKSKQQILDMIYLEQSEPAQALHNALITDDLESFTYWLNTPKGTSIINNGPYEKTLLYKAFINGKTDFVKALIKAGADVNMECNESSLLYQACVLDQTDIVDALIKAGADVNMLCNGSSLLYQACLREQSDIVNTLINCGADVNLQCNGCSPLYSACISGQTDIVKLLIKAGADVDVKYQGCSPLYSACISGLTDIVKVLINAGADANTQCDGLAALSHAIICGYTNVAQQLIEAGAKPSSDEKNQLKKTAKKSKDYEMLNYLRSLKKPRLLTKLVQAVKNSIGHKSDKDKQWYSKLDEPQTKNQIKKSAIITPKPCKASTTLWEHISHPAPGQHDASHASLLHADH